MFSGAFFEKKNNSVKFKDLSHFLKKSTLELDEKLCFDQQLCTDKLIPSTVFLVMLKLCIKLA